MNASEGERERAKHGKNNSPVQTNDMAWTAVRRHELCHSLQVLLTLEQDGEALHAHLHIHKSICIPLVAIRRKRNALDALSTRGE